MLSVLFKLSLLVLVDPVDFHDVIDELLSEANGSHQSQLTQQLFKVHHHVQQRRPCLAHAYVVVEQDDFGEVSPQEVIYSSGKRLKNFANTAALLLTCQSKLVHALHKLLEMQEESAGLHKGPEHLLVQLELNSLVRPREV